MLDTNLTYTITIDIQSGVDEKQSAIRLQKETSHIFDNSMCVFHVVSDPLLGLECTDHTFFDMVFVDYDESQTFQAYSFLRSLRTSGTMIPVVLLMCESIAEGSPIDGLPAIGYDAAPSDDRFTSCLRRPYTKRELCDVIRSIMLPDDISDDDYPVDNSLDYNMLELFLMESFDSDLYDL